MQIAKINFNVATEQGVSVEDMRMSLVHGDDRSLYAAMERGKRAWPLIQMYTTQIKEGEIEDLIKAGMYSQERTRLRQKYRHDAQQDVALSAGKTAEQRGKALAKLVELGDDPSLGGSKGL